MQSSVGVNKTVCLPYFANLAAINVSQLGCLPFMEMKRDKGFDASHVMRLGFRRPPKLERVYATIALMSNNGRTRFTVLQS